MKWLFEKITSNNKNCSRELAQIQEISVQIKFSNLKLTSLTNKPYIVLHPGLLSYCMCNLAFVCELIVFSTVLHGACRDRVDSYHLFALPSVYGAQAWTTSFVVKRKWIEMLITPCFCGEDFWFIALSRAIPGEMTSFHNPTATRRSFENIAELIHSDREWAVCMSDRFS